MLFDQKVDAMAAGRNDNVMLAIVAEFIVAFFHDGRADRRLFDFVKA
jgi:hypothetical protein